MHYITKNPKNTEGYQKMVQSCKYFFLKNPILIIFGLNYSQTGWTASIKNGYKNIDKNTILCKLWITDTIRVYRDNIINGTFDSSIIPKIYRCAVKYLSLYEQIISLNEFTFLCSSAERLTLEEVTVKNDDGIEVAFENLIKKLPQLKGIVL
uniref:Uncharacterized protein n=1 Tax=Panagrolaimus superbus TaxID=310955 RepID=A0A914Z4G3_9BILA